MRIFKVSIKYLLVLFLMVSCQFFSGGKPSEKKECVVLVCNKNYFPKFLSTLNLLTTKGKYHGDICLVIGNDLVGDDLLNNKLIKKNRVIIQHFPDLEFPESFLEKARTLPNFRKLFQYHKFHLFNTYFKQWKTILYIDCGLKISSDIRPILETEKSNTLLAHSDAYPTFVWKLHDQFGMQDSECYKKLDEKFNLNIDYFQTTIMLYDTNIIQENTFSDLYHLALEYPLSISNDQGIMALYFTNVVPIWKQIPIGNKKMFFYDYNKRERGKHYIMLKV